MKLFTSFKWLLPTTLAFVTLFSAASSVEASKGGGKTHCVRSADSSRANNTWTSVHGTSMAADFATPAKALRTLQDRQGGGKATKLGLSKPDLQAMRHKLDQHKDDTVLEAPDSSSSTRFHPSHVSRSTTPDGTRTINEHYADPGTCEARFVGMIREIPVSSKGALQYHKARWSQVNSSELYHSGTKEFMQGNYLESFRMLGHTASWSLMMRKTLATRVKIVIDQVPGFRAGLDRIKLPANRSIELRDAPNLDASVIRNVSAQSGDQLLKFNEAGPNDGYYKLGAVGNWDMVYDATNEDVGFIHRIPGLGRRPEAPSTATSVTG